MKAPMAPPNTTPLIVTFDGRFKPWRRLGTLPLTLAEPDEVIRVEWSPTTFIGNRLRDRFL